MTAARQGRAPREKKTEDLHIRLPPSVREAAEKLAAADGRSFSNMIERLILEKTQRRE